MDLLPVEVEWVDSSSHGEGAWHGIEQVRTDAVKEATIRCVCVGFLVAADKTQVTLALGHNGGSDVMEPVTIPRACVVAIHELTRKRVKK